MTALKNGLAGILSLWVMLSWWIRTGGFRRQERTYPVIMGGAVHNMLSTMQICQGFLPVDMNTGANDGDWVQLREYQTLIVLLYGAVGTAGDDPILTLEQATDVAGGGAKPLAVIDEVYQKQAAANLLAVGQYTRVTQAAAATFTNLTAAEQALIWAVEINANELDQENAFTAVRARVADVGAAAQLGSMVYILMNPRHIKRPDQLLSAIVD